MSLRAILTSFAFATTATATALDYDGCLKIVAHCAPGEHAGLDQLKIACEARRAQLHCAEQARAATPEQRREFFDCAKPEDLCQQTENVGFKLLYACGDGLGQVASDLKDGVQALLSGRVDLSSLLKRCEQDQQTKLDVLKELGVYRNPSDAPEEFSAMVAKMDCEDLRKFTEQRVQTTLSRLEARRQTRMAETGRDAIPTAELAPTPAEASALAFDRVRAGTLSRAACYRREAAVRTVCHEVADSYLKVGGPIGAGLAIKLVGKIARGAVSPGVKAAATAKPIAFRAPTVEPIPAPAETLTRFGRLQKTLTDEGMAFVPTKKAVEGVQLVGDLASGNPYVRMAARLKEHGYDLILSSAKSGDAAGALDEVNRTLTIYSVDGPRQLKNLDTRGVVWHEYRHLLATVNGEPSARLRLSVDTANPLDMSLRGYGTRYTLRGDEPFAHYQGGHVERTLSRGRTQGQLHGANAMASRMQELYGDVPTVSGRTATYDPVTGVVDIKFTSNATAHAPAARLQRIREYTGEAPDVGAYTVHVDVPPGTARAAALAEAQRLIERYRVDLAKLRENAAAQLAKPTR